MDINTEIVLKVEAFAAKSHGDQKRKYTPEPYIVHPVKVMKLCADYTDDVTILSAALLHDVLEDTPVTSEELLAFLKEEMGADRAQLTLKYVLELTDQYTKKSFPHFNRKMRKKMEMERLVNTSSESQTIKYADIFDNCDLTDHDPDFARVFLRECRQLLERMDKGNADLRKKALDKVNFCLTKVNKQPSANDSTIQFNEKG